jgi:hypothetical protein
MGPMRQVIVACCAAAALSGCQPQPGPEAGDTVVEGVIVTVFGDPPPGGAAGTTEFHLVLDSGRSFRLQPDTAAGFRPASLAAHAQRRVRVTGAISADSMILTVRSVAPPDG